MKSKTWQFRVQEGAPNTKVDQSNKRTETQWIYNLEIEHLVDAQIIEREY